MGYSAAAAAFGLAGGGYVVQKWRPHRAHTQNCSGRQAVPGAGSFISIEVPQRRHLIWRSMSAMRGF